MTEVLDKKEKKIQNADKNAVKIFKPWKWKSLTWKPLDAGEEFDKIATNKSNTAKSC